ncbi:MAG: apolipoprotein N-acyltransferase, partial [Alphaproteobacteria bacterium]
MQRLMWMVGAGLAGAQSSFAMAPYHWWWLLFLTLPVMVLAIDGSIAPDTPWHKRMRAAFWPGLAFGFGFLALSLGWIGNALLVDADRYGWLLPFAKYGLPLGLALFYGLGAALAGLVWSRGVAGAFALAFGLGVSEWLRGFVLTGFPWNTLSQSLADTPLLMQGFALIGPDGMTLVLIIAAASMIGLVQPANWQIRLLRLGPAVIIVCGLAAYGGLRLSAPVMMADGVVRIVQPNVAQKDKWKPDQRMAITRHLLDLTPVKATGRPAVVVWPEAATPYFLQDSPAVLAAIGAKLGRDQVVVTGTPRHGPIQEDFSAQTYNGIVVVNNLGSVVASYDKHHLVPFGEYV